MKRALDLGHFPGEPEEHSLFHTSWIERMLPRGATPPTLTQSISPPEALPAISTRVSGFA